MKRKLFFENVDSLDGVCEVIGNNIKTIAFMNPFVFQYHYRSLLRMEDGKNEKFLRFVHYVDQWFSRYGHYGFSVAKLTTVLSGATYYCDFYSQIEEYTDGELSILANYTSIDPINVYFDNLKRFPEVLLSIVEHKTADFTKRDDLILWYDFSCDLGKESNWLMQKLQEDNLEQLVEESLQFQRKIQDTVLEEDVYYDSRRL